MQKVIARESVVMRKACGALGPAQATGGSKAQLSRWHRWAWGCHSEAAVVNAVSAGQGFWVWVCWGAAIASSPSAFRTAFPARHSLPPSSSLWAALTSAGSEQAQLLAFTFKTTIATCACPLGASHFQTGQLVWFESSTALQGGGVAGEDMDTVQVARMFIMGRNSQVFYWFKCVSSQSMLQLMMCLRAPLLARSSDPNPLKLCLAAWEGVPMSPALLARVPAAGLGEMQLPMGRSLGFKVGDWNEEEEKKIYLGRIRTGYWEAVEQVWRLEISLSVLLLCAIKNALCILHDPLFMKQVPYLLFAGVTVERVRRDTGAHLCFFL